MNMYKKIIRFCFLEPKCWFGKVIPALGVVLLLQTVVIGAQNRRYGGLVRKKQNMETALVRKAKTAAPVQTVAAPAPRPSIEIRKRDYLNGIIQRDGEHMVLIGNRYYRVGDHMNHYVVSRITDESAFLLDEVTQERKYIYFKN